MRATIHNGKTSHLGAFTPRHNDRNFNISHAEHIDPERVKDNRYWNWTGKEITFEAAEVAFYEKHIRQHLDAQNTRYRAQRQAERVKTMDEYRKSPQTCPEEVILQIGKLGDTIPADMMARIIQEQINWEQKQFPGTMTVSFEGAAKPITAVFELYRLSTNKDWEAHTEVPGKYERIELQDLLKQLIK